ncbi:MAG: hypothetical protein RL291_131 [Pseudomonadota bacterium]
MITHRIKELRERRGWSQEHLGTLVNRTKHAISRLEKGDSSLDLAMAKQIADAFGVTLGEVIVLNGKSHGGGFRDDAATYEPAAGDPLLAHVGPNRYLLRVETDALDQAGLARGDIAIVDDSAKACHDVGPLQLVVVNYRLGKTGRSVQLLRQFVPPDLLITNASQTNEPSLSVKRDEAAIVGVVVDVFRRLRRANG